MNRGKTCAGIFLTYNRRRVVVLVLYFHQWQATTESVWTPAIISFRALTEILNLFNNCYSCIALFRMTILSVSCITIKLNSLVALGSFWIRFTVLKINFHLLCISGFCNTFKKRLKKCLIFHLIPVCFSAWIDWSVVGYELKVGSQKLRKEKLARNKMILPFSHKLNILLWPK